VWTFAWRGSHSSAAAGIYEKIATGVIKLQDTMNGPGADQKLRRTDSMEGSAGGSGGSDARRGCCNTDTWAQYGRRPKEQGNPLSGVPELEDLEDEAAEPVLSPVC
jgi:hypothetical protein